MTTLTLPEHPTVPVHITIPVLWGEMDAFLHVNNIHYIKWCEAARMAYLEALKLKDYFAGSKIGPILARTEIDYFIPLTSPDVVTVSVSITHLGNTSLTSEYRITSEKHKGKLAAQSKGIIVLINYDTGQKVPLDETVRSKIVAFENKK
jgi:acyl-CoA thioester hydrolase